jgi:hypothetical protein
MREFRSGGFAPEHSRLVPRRAIVWGHAVNGWTKTSRKHLPHLPGVSRSSQWIVKLGCQGRAVNPCGRNLTVWGSWARPPPRLLNVIYSETTCQISFAITPVGPRMSTTNVSWQDEISPRVRSWSCRSQAPSGLLCGANLGCQGLAIFFCPAVAHI